MTGRDYIIYILENNLEDEEIFKDGRLLGFMTEIEAAIKFEVSLATIRTWANMGHIKSIRIGSTLYIPINSKDPRLNNRKE